MSAPTTARPGRHAAEPARPGACPTCGDQIKASCVGERVALQEIHDRLHHGAVYR